MFNGLSPYQIAVITILFIQMCAVLTTAGVVSSKYYAARYLHKEEQENLEINAQIRKFFREAILTEDQQAKFIEFIKKESQ